MSPEPESGRSRRVDRRTFLATLTAARVVCWCLVARRLVILHATVRVGDDRR